MSKEVTIEIPLSSDKLENELNKPNFMRMLHEWTANTTMHGVKFITEKSDIRFRRITWFLIVAICMAFLFRQAGDRITYYNSDPTTVNVVINKLEKIFFPAVTLCNQNVFMLTKAVNTGLYPYVTNLYRNETLPEVNSSIMDWNMTYIYQMTSYDLNKMLISCEWYGAKCSADNFSIQPTEHGFCYSFNARPPQLTVTDTGSGNGLTLVLNVQQYEYMAGPSEAAGIRFHMHTPDALPMVTDLGQAAAIGTYTYVGLKLVTSLSLPHPTGNCHSTTVENYNEKRCLLTCKANHYLALCGCIEFYMAQIIHANVCSLRQQYECIPRAAQEFIMEGRRDCGCRTACNETIYEPNLSFSSSSNLVLFKFGKEPDFRKNLESDFNLARDYHSVVNNATFTNDIEMFRNLRTIYRNYENNFTTFMEVLKQTKHYLQLEVNFHRRAFKEKMEYLTEQLKVVRYHYWRGFESIDERTLSMVSHQFYEYAFEYESYLRKLQSLSFNQTGLRDMLLFQAKVALNTRRRSAEVSNDRVMELYDNYVRAIPYISKDSDTNIDNVKVQAFTPKNLLKSSVQNEEKFFSENIGVELNDTYTHMLELLDEVYRTQTINEESREEWHATFLFQSKRWLDFRADFLMDVFHAPLSRLKERNSSFTEEGESALNLLDGLVNDVDTLLSYVDGVREHVNYIDTLMSQMESYMNLTPDSLIKQKAFLKSRIARAFTSDEATMDKFTLSLQKLGEKIRYNSIYIPRQWNITLSKLLNLWPYILNDDNAYDQYLYYNRTEWVGKNFTDFKRNLSNEYYNIQEKLIVLQEMGNQDEILSSQLVEVMTALKTYGKEGEINNQFLRENFLTLSIFFRELSVEAVRQQTAYEWTALLSDLGGTFGLFVGASLLTMVEVVDLVLQIFYHPFKRMCYAFSVSARKKKASVMRAMSHRHHQTCSKQAGGMKMMPASAVPISKEENQIPSADEDENLLQTSAAENPSPPLQAV